MSLSESHLDDEQLALRALGEPLSSTLSDHVQKCPRCTAEIDQLSAVVATARSLTDVDQPQQPDPEVWDRIQQELRLDAVPTPVPSVAVTDSATVTSITGRQRRWSTGLLVAASVLGVVAGGTLALGAVAMVSDDAPAVPVASVVATTSLTALPDHDGKGQAEIIDTPTGQELVVDVSDLTSGDGFYEVWLINPDTFEMVGLGALAGDSGRFAIPDGLDLSQYSVVDVSIEPFDGDPIHSKDSVVRGELSV